MRLFLVLATLLLAPSTHPADHPAAPATKPAQASEMTLNQGHVRFVVPDGWKALEKSADDMSVHLRTADGKAQLTFNVVKQRSAMPDSASKTVVDGTMKSIRQRAESSKSEIITEPAMGDDPRFFAMVTARTRKDGKTDDRMYAFRQDGLIMLTIACEVRTEKPEVAQPIHKQAADMLAKAIVGDGEPTIGNTPVTKPSADPSGPTLLPKAHLKIESPPAGWRSRKANTDSGILVTYRELGGENGLIIVSLRALPPEAKKDPKLRDALIDELLAGEKTALEIPGAKELEKPHNVSDARFVRKTVQKVETQGMTCVVISRQLVVGNALLSVASFAPQDRAEQIEKLADAVGTSAKPIGK